MTKDSYELAAMELMEEALNQPSDQREKFIQESDVPEAVKKRALELLSVNKSAASVVRTGAAKEIDADEPVPEKIGSYRILRLLERGGMGAVYLGERAEGDFDHVAAIKLIKAGLLSESVIERFRRERQILAKLSHNNIARLFDGGETDNGSPYIVMEFIEGSALNHWIRDTKPTLDERLDLFREICDAVGFAHQNLIIHRDLTPSNILVTPLNEAKLIDFGIAKPHEEESDNPENSLGAFSLTPGFAAPERSSGASANTLTDIYSLGKILQLLLGDSKQPELDAIAQKAAHNDPNKRYKTAENLANDVARYQEDFPVDAFAKNQRYRLLKLAKRRKIEVGAAMAVAATLIAGLTASLIGFNEARNAQFQAETRFAEVREMANTLLFDIYDSADAVPGTTDTRRMLAETGQRYLDTLVADPAAPADVRLEAGKGYNRLADVMGGPGGGNLGLRNEALNNYELADKILAKLFEDDRSNQEVALALANLRYDRSRTMVHITEDYERGIKLARTIGPILDSACKVGNNCSLIRAKALIVDGENLHWSDRPDDALDRYDLALLEIEKLRSEFRKTENGVLAEAQAHFLKSRAYYAKEEWNETIEQAGIASRLLTNALERGIVSPAIERALAGSEFVRGGTLDDIGRTGEALRALDRTYSIMQKLVTADSEDKGSMRLLAVSASNRAEVLASAGRYKEAIEGAKEALTIRQSLLKESPEQVGFFRDVAIQHRDLGTIYNQAGRRHEACRFWRKSIALFDTLDQRWGLSDFDRNFAYAKAQKSLQSC